MKNWPDDPRLKKRRRDDGSDGGEGRVKDGPHDTLLIRTEFTILLLLIVFITLVAIFG